MSCVTSLTSSLSVQSRLELLWKRLMIVSRKRCLLAARTWMSTTCIKIIRNATNCHDSIPEDDNLSIPWHMSSDNNSRVENKSRATDWIFWRSFMTMTRTRRSLTTTFPVQWRYKKRTEFRSITWNVNSRWTASYSNLKHKLEKKSTPIRSSVRVYMSVVRRTVYDTRYVSVTHDAAASLTERQSTQEEGNSRAMN